MGMATRKQVTKTSSRKYHFKGESMGEALVGIAVALVVFLICREIVCWYFKYNAMVALLTEIRDLLKVKQAGA